ncbi:MAG: MOP flippase family protein [Gaiellaceae bacterium]
MPVEAPLAAPAAPPAKPTLAPGGASPGSPRPAGPPSLTQRTLSGMGWTGSSRVGSQIAQFVITAVLARLLVPADFGLVQMYVVFTGFAMLFVDLGFVGAIVQRKELDERHLSSAFWLNLGSSTAVAVLIAALSPAVAAFYGESQLVPLMIVAALNFIIAAPALVQIAQLRRALNFRFLAITEIVATVVSGVVAIAAAVAGLGVWSLVLLLLVASATKTAILWFSSDWRPKRLVDRTAVRELWRFGGNLIGSYTLSYWARNADNLLIGKVLGLTTLGLYSRAYNLMLLPVQQPSAIATNVMFSSLSGIQEDRKRVKRAYLRAVGLIAALTFPVLTGLLVLSDRFISVVYGEKWLDAAPLLSVLCIAGIVQSVQLTSYWLYGSQGRPDLLFRWNLISFPCVIASFFVGLHWGALGVTIAYTVVTAALAYPAVSIAGRRVDMSFLEVAARLRNVVLASGVMGLLVFALGQAMPSGYLPAVQLLLLILIGAAAYFPILLLLRDENLRELRGLVRRTRGGRVRS